MTWIWKPQSSLGPALGGKGLFTAWVGSAGLPASLWGSGAATAAEDLGRVMSPEDPPAGPVPFFAGLSDRKLGQDWIEAMASGYAREDDARVFRAQVAALSAGKAQVVITGQQPGFMGGPLYTLYKAATTVALAERLTAAGQPTVPLFWMGDDDDDLVEAFAPVLWNPVDQDIQDSQVDLKSLLARGRTRPCVGNLDAARFSESGKRWLQAHASSTVLGEQMSSLWEQAISEQWNWTRLFRSFLLGAFAGHGLMVVSGNDSFLHGSAASTYHDLGRQRESLRRLAEARGQAISRAGFPVPVSDRSLHRHLFRIQAEGRVFVSPEESLPDPGMLRPGVLLRSPIQDALFQPTAVVVGPGELAYLRQIDPLYEALGVGRCPLVPRLFGQILPPGLTEVKPVASPAPEELASHTSDLLAEEVERILREQLSIDPTRARELAQGRRRRLQKSLVTLFQNETLRQAGQLAASQPAWIQPQGKRQERLLASACSVTLWGDEFIRSLVAAAHAHLDEGLAGRWNQFVGLVP